MARAAGEVPDCFLGGGEQQLCPGVAGVPVDHSGQVLVRRNAADGGDRVPPAAGGPRSQSQPGQLLIGEPGPGPEIGGQLGQGLVHGRQLRAGWPDSTSAG